MRRWFHIGLAVGLAVLVAAPAFAQEQQRRGRGRGGMGGGPGGLLLNESVQKELKLDSAQVEKIKAAVTEVREKHRDDLAKLRDLSQEERRTKGTELFRQVGEETRKAVEPLLTPEQVKRYHQIELQAAARRSPVGVYERPEVEKALKLTTEQKDKLKTIREDFEKDQREVAQGGGRRSPETREKLQALRKETEEKVQGVLTDPQKKTWKDLTGEPFRLEGGRRGGNRQRGAQQP